MGFAIFMLGSVLIGGTLIALLWWRLADVMFPGMAARTGQGRRRARPDRTAGATVVRGFAEQEEESGKG